MTLQALSPPRFVRKTQLGPGEYRRNFRQIDADVIAAITSREADGVTPLMSKIYLRLVSAPPEFWEREGVLYVSAGDKGGTPIKTSKVLYGLLGVASATAHKALKWMHEQGIIGYFAGKNGAGIRIFINRASGSIGVRADAAGKNFLPAAGGSKGRAAGSAVEPAFNDSYAVSEGLEIDLTPRAPKTGAEHGTVVKNFPDTTHGTDRPSLQAAGTKGWQPTAALPPEVPVDEIVSRLRRQLEPSLQAIAKQAAALEHERTREWLENRGLPKAARVAQREAYNVLRQNGLMRERAGDPRAHAEVGRGVCPASAPRALSVAEVEELAQACMAMLEVQGRSIEHTLSEMSSDAGGFLLPADVFRVREKAETLMNPVGDLGLEPSEEGRAGRDPFDT